MPTVFISGKRDRFSNYSLELTVPTGREYISGVVKRRDPSAGAGIRGVSGKANSCPSK